MRRCAECSGRRLAFAQARAAIVYDHPARLFVQAWKERGQRRLAHEAAAIVVETLASAERLLADVRPGSIPIAPDGGGIVQPRPSPPSSPVSGSSRYGRSRDVPAPSTGSEGWG